MVGDPTFNMMGIDAMVQAPVSWEDEDAEKVMGMIELEVEQALDTLRIRLLAIHPDLTLQVRGI